MSAAPNPSKFLLIAALGVGAYWFASRRASAAPVVTAAARRPAASSGGSLLSAVGHLVGNLLGTSNTSPAALATGAAVGAANAVSDANYAGADFSRMASSAVDGVAANVPNMAVYDSAAYGLDGSNGAYWN